MNIFVLDNDMRSSVQSYIDKHIVKMPLESVQILFTNMWLTNTIPDIKTTDVEELVYSGVPPYRPTHHNHPCTIWARESKQNTLWLVDLVREMRLEAIYRFSHEDNWYHKSHLLLEFFLGENPDCFDSLPDIGLTEHPKCMPEQYKVDSVVESYRNYYRGDKRPIAGWKNRPLPEWWF